jgi:hypothetical protein
MSRAPRQEPGHDPAGAPRRDTPHLPPLPAPSLSLGGLSAAGTGGAAGFPLALVLALLLLGPAGPTELVTVVRRRAAAGIGGRLERPG